MKTREMAKVMASTDTRMNMQVKADVDLVDVSTKQLDACLLA